MRTRIPTEHTQTTQLTGDFYRSPSPYFAPPAPSGMREPYTNFFSIITAPDPGPTLRKAGAR